jgi:HD-GYP domain-containing protein (c-di-GMP phosphodiesterase class II)
MAGARPYRAAFSIDDALQTLEAGIGTLYDERMVSACVKIFKEDYYTLPTMRNIDDAPILNKHL